MKPITQIDIFSAIVLLTDETVVKRNESPSTPENPLEYPLGSSDRPDPEALLSVVLSLTGNYTLNVHQEPSSSYICCRFLSGKQETEPLKIKC